MGLIIKAEVEGREALLKLTDNDVAAAKGIIKRFAKTSLYCMKKDNGAPLFFINETNAVNAQSRHQYTYLFTVTSADLEKAQTEKKG